MANKETENFVVPVWKIVHDQNTSSPPLNVILVAVH